MRQADIYLSVIVPAYNEATRIGKTLQRLQEYLTGVPFGYEIMVVSDGSSDATVEVVRQLSRQISGLRIIERSVNRGKGFTVREGMLAARGHIRLFCDADNSTDIGHFDQMKPLFDRGRDMVIASRHAKDARQARQAVPQPFYKRLVGRLGNRLVQLVAFPGVWDTQCGFKAFRAEAAERIFSQATIDGWGFDIEVLALARALNYQIGVIPAHWINDQRSHVRWFDYLRVVLDTLAVRRNFMIRRYDLARIPRRAVDSPPMG